MSEVFGQLTYWHNAQWVHAEDRASLQRTHPFGLGTNNGVGVFSIDNQQDGYLFLRVEDNIYRIQEDAFKPFPSPKFWIGDTVKTRNGTPRTGWIARIGWHFARNEPIYFLEIADAMVRRKELKRRYFQEELEPVSD